MNRRTRMNPARRARSVMNERRRETARPRSRGKLNENSILETIESRVENLDRRYRPYFNALDESMLAKARSIKPADLYALGTMLESWETYHEIMEAEGSVSDLGTLPKVALDVITVAFGESIAPHIASVQPIDEELGLIYYKKLVAQYGRGDVTTDDTLVDAETPTAVFTGFASAFKRGEACGTTSNGVTEYIGGTTANCAVLSNRPIRPNTVKIYVALSGGTITCEDDGSGNLLGVGFSSSTIDYDTGVWEINISNPGEAVAITADYEQIFEETTSLPTLDFELASKSIRAHQYVLRGITGLFKNFQLQKRFGSTISQDEISKDLVGAINAEIGYNLIALIDSNKSGSVSWSATPPDGISYFEHKQTFVDKIADAEATMLGNLGRGTVDVIICGRNIGSLIQTLPGFENMYDSDSAKGGPHVFGKWNGILVIRCPATVSGITADKAVLLYNGASIFESAAVYSPYMPLVVTDPTNSIGNNPVRSQRAAAQWAGIDTLIGAFATGLEKT